MSFDVFSVSLDLMVGPGLCQEVRLGDQGPDLNPGQTFCIHRVVRASS